MIFTAARCYWLLGGRRSAGSEKGSVLTIDTEVQDSESPSMPRQAAPRVRLEAKLINNVLRLRYAAPIFSDDTLF